MRLFIFWAGICALSTTLSAQSAEQDLHKVLEPLANGKYLYFENQYLYYDEGDKPPSDTLDGRFHRNGTQQFARMGQLEMLVVGDLMITADHEDRVVSAQSAAPSGSVNEWVDAKKWKELLDSREATVQYAAGRGTLKVIVLTDPEKPGDKVTILYDPTTWAIKESSMSTDDPFADPYTENIGKVTVVVKYLNYSTAPKAFPYKMEQYVRKEGKRYVAAGKCKGYRVI